MEGAVFVLEKKLLDKYSKQDKELILSIFKKGVANLTRLRHPSILTVQHSLEESRESLAFATEPIFASLANILGSHENMPVPPPKILKEFELFDIEIKYGFLQLAEGLAFLHNDVKMMHGNINPESILVNHNGAWKIAGFDFCSQFGNSPDADQYVFGEINIEGPPPCHPHLDYIAPERLLGGSNSYSGDMFSVGVLFYAVHNSGKSLFMNTGCNTATIKQNMNQLKNLPPSTFSILPQESKDHVQLLLNFTAELRPDAFQISKLPIFEDVGVKTLQYLDSLYQWDNLQKSQFYKGLPQIIAKMPKRVKLHRVVPCLAKEYRTPEMVPFVLPNVLLISEDATKEEFQELILQDLLPLFRLQEPVQIMLIFIQKMELLLSKCPQTVITNHVLPMIYQALESDAQQIQELCLSVIPKFASLVEYSAMKNALMPRIKKLCICTSYLSIRVNCLLCIGKLLEHLDKWLVLDEVLPFLPQIPSKEPAVLMGVLGILKLTMMHKKLGITKEIMATKIIPFLMPLAIENGLTLNQFNSIMSVVKEMVSFVETEHKAKLEQLNSIREEHGSTLEMTEINNQSFVPCFNLEENKLSDDMFKNLGLNSSNPLKGNSLSNSPATKNTEPLSTKVYQPSSMTLEEKKTLAWNQEQQRKWNSGDQGKPLVPSPSSLINSNLNELNISKPADSFSSLQIFPKPNYNIQNNWSPSPSLQPSLIGTYPSITSPQGHSINPMSSCLTNSSPLSLNQYQSFTNNLPQTRNPPINLQQSFGMVKPHNPPPAMDLRSLDSLLPNIGSRPTLSQLEEMNRKPKSPTAIPMIPSPPSSKASLGLDDLLS